jgi:nitrite reductase (cytochrome c-552)
MLERLSEFIRRKPIWGWMLFLSIIVVVFLIGLLAASITERRAEVASVFNNRKVEIKDFESKSDVWGINYPREFETWKKTADMDFKSKHMGNMRQDVLEERPEMVVLWAGYSFAMDYETPRGHSHAINDMRNTLRTGSPENVEDNIQPATCWTCKSPDVPRMMHEMGIAEFYKGKWSTLGEEIVNPIGCADCHDPKTMQLTITRPGLIEAYERQGKSIKDATAQEMRSLACAQCHVEYYFKGDDKYLTFPWDKGMTVETIEQYYDEVKHVDWVHKLSKAPMLKAQHPDFEIFNLGPHAKRGLSCADCHMPYKVDGGIKYSDHQIVSPLKNINNTCQTCHRDSEDDLRLYVEEYQDKALEIRDRVEVELAKAHITAKYAWDNGATELQMKSVLELLRQAQWRWDFVVASHGATFHAPVESQRILAHSLDRTMQAQLALQKVLFALNVNTELSMPDISTKEKAQEYIGLDMKILREKKENFKETIIPAWIKKAEEKGKLTSQKM